jgi:aspartate/methionine/tyrosine aminotransferase
LTPAALESAIQKQAPHREEQKLLVLNYPCNPTGQSYSPLQLKALATIARKHSLVILSDEIYALLSYRNHEHHSIAEYYPEGALVTGGLSKDRSAGGFRLGVMLLPTQETNLKGAILAIAAATWSTVAAPIQYAAVEAYRPTPEILQYIRDCTAIHELVTTSVHRRLVAQEIRCPTPEGAFYLFPDWNRDRDSLRRRGVATSSALADTLLREWNVASLPGADFGMPAENLCIRIATVDYDGAKALKQFTANRQKAWADPDRFANAVAPQLIAACDQLTRFTEVIRQGEQLCR